MERPYHPSDRSSYSRRSTSSAAPSSSSRATSSGRRRIDGFGEIKSPPIAAPSSSSSSGGDGGAGVDGANKSLDEHISSRNSRATSAAAASLYEIMDIASLDKGRAATWASSDWCAEARKSREYLRKAGAPPRVAVGGVGVDADNRVGKRMDDGNDSGRGGYGGRYKNTDDINDRRSSSRERTPAEAELKEDDGLRNGINKRMAERDRIKHNTDASVSGRSQYRSSASLPVRRHDDDDTDNDDDYDDDDNEEDDDNGTFRTVSRGGRMDHDAALPAMAMSFSGRARSNSRGSEYYRIPRQDQHPQQQQQVHRPPSSRSHSRGPPLNDESRDNAGIARSSSNGRPLRSPTPERGNSRPRKPSSGGDAWTRSSSRSRPADTNRQSITPTSTTAYHGGGDGVGVRDREDVDDGQSIRRMQSSKNDSKIGRSDFDMSRGRSASERTPGTEGRSQSRDTPTRSWNGRSSSRHSSHYGQEFRRTDSVRSRGRLSAERTPEADVRSNSRSPMGLWDERSSSRHSLRKRADRRQGQGRQHHEEEETRRRSPSPGGRETRRPPRDPSGERRSLSRTPSRREDNAPRDRLSPPRSSVEVYRGEHAQSLDGRYAGKAIPSTPMEKSLSSTRHKDKQRRHPQGCQEYNPGDVTDYSQSTGFLSKQTIKSSSSNHKSSKKHINSKDTVASVRSYSSSETPETGPLTSSTVKSSKGNFLKLRISRMTPSTPPQKDDSNFRPATLNRVPSVKDDSTKGSIMDEEEIVTCLFDRKGYCIRHPSVQLRKKKLFGAWNVIMVNCPECCMDEMRRLRRVSKQMAKSAARVDGAGRKSNGGSGEEKGTKSKKKTPRAAHDPEQKKLSSDRSPVSRSLSRSRSWKETPDATDAKKFVQRSKSRSKGRQGHRDTPSSDNSPPIFEFEIPLDALGDLTSSYSPAPRSIKSHKSSSSKKSKQSGKSVKTNKSAKSTRTNKSGKSTRTNKTSKSMSGRGSSIKRESRGLSSSSQQDKGKSRDGDSRSVSRESRPRFSQRITRQGSKLRVAKMPYKDHYNREGSYTGEINEYGQPNGRGTLRYMDGTEFEGKWTDGHSDEIDASMEKLKNGFSNWKSNTKMAKGGIGSQQSTQIHSNTGAPTISKGEEVQQHGRVIGMKWSDVNGFSGHYSGDVDSQNIPNGCGLMRYTNGVVEEGVFCNGVFQPPTTGDENKEAPSSSMSVWSLKSSPTMAFGQAGHSVLAGHHDRDNGGMGASSVRGAPSSVHLGGPGGLYMGI